MSDKLFDQLASAIERPDGGTIGKIAAAERVLDAFVVIPKVDLPEVTRSLHDENTYYAERENIVYTSEENARMWVMRDVAVWQYIADKLRSRRDELARDIAGEAEGDPDCRVNYAGMVKTARIAIDRIIALEQAKS